MNELNEHQDQIWKLRFNKDFNVSTWLEMEPPPHMNESEWRLAVSTLHTLLTQTKYDPADREKLILGWKSRNGLL